jgi:putative tryptophan/tyrosine transport system substrate-binding protein
VVPHHARAAGGKAADHRVPGRRCFGLCPVDSRFCVMVANLKRILALALDARLPTVFSTRDFVRAGGFMSYGPNYSDLFRRSADYVDKILRGAKPGDIPVEQPTRFELVINVNTAKALGVTIPESFLLRADEVIE